MMKVCCGDCFLCMALGIRDLWPVMCDPSSAMEFGKNRVPEVGIGGWRNSSKDATLVNNILLNMANVVKILNLNEMKI